MSLSIDILEPPTLTIQVRGETLTCTPLVARQLPRISALAKTVMPKFAPEAMVSWQDLFIEAGEEMVEMVSIMANKPMEWAGNLPPAALLQLLNALVEFNEDFFTGRFLARNPPQREPAKTPGS